MACFAYSLSWWSSLSYLHLIIQSTEFSLFILSTALLFSLFHSHEMDFFKWLWENYVFFEIFIINLEIKENKRRRFLSWQNRGKENEKKKKETRMLLLSNKLLNQRLSKVKTNWPFCNFKKVFLFAWVQWQWTQDT